MIIERLPVGVYAANCYIVADEDKKECIVLDPGGSPDKIIDFINKNKLKTVAIVLTHGHVDHIAEADNLRNKLNTKIYVHKNDSKMLENSTSNLSKMNIYETVEFSADEMLKDNDIIKFGDIEATVIHTPGHTRGGIVLKIENFLFTGDTLFQNSFGRTDLEGGNMNALCESIKNKLFKLDGSLNILPGHGGPSSIAAEKLSNPILRVKIW